MIYKVTNITDTLNKRDVNYNKPLEIKYNRGFLQKTENLNPKEVKYFVIEGNIIPNSIQEYKLKHLVIVEEANYMDLTEKKEPKKKLFEKKPKKSTNKTIKSTKSTKYTKKTKKL